MDVAPACSMNTAFKKCPSKWAGRCTTLDECQETCRKTKGCKAFNWWPGKGGCRHILAEVSKCTEKETEWTSVGGSPDCEATVEAPSDCDTCPKKCQKDPVDEEDDEEEDPLDEPEDDESSSLSDAGTDDESQTQSQRFWRRRRRRRRGVSGPYDVRNWWDLARGH